MKLNRMLQNLDSYPFHMPGHKRNPDFGISGSEIDITEIGGFDDLHTPCGVLDEMQKRCAELFGFKNSIISVNGSTCCVLAAISALCSKGDDIIIARNCHKSVYNACYINELKVTYIEPDFIDEIGVYGRTSQEALDAAIKSAPNASAVVITSPTYEGVVSKVECNIPLIIDAAHGAHFGFADFLPERAKADIVINSLHKTLPALTQTAVIHINNGEYLPAVKKYMDIFESSSPSYVLMASVDKCFDFLDDCAKSFENYKTLLKNFYSRAEKLDGIHFFKNDDVTRIVVYSDRISATKLGGILRENGVEPEAVTANYVILISSVCDSKEGFERLLNALMKAAAVNGTHEAKRSKYEIPEKAFEAYEIKEVKKSDFDSAAGKVCGEYIFAYPPGIPIIVPGEIVSRDIIDEIRFLKKSGVNLISDSDEADNIILTKA